MSSRESILETLRGNQPDPVGLPEVPRFDEHLGESVPRFRETLERMGGKLADPPADGDWSGWLKARYPDARVIASVVPEIAGNREVAGAEPRTLEDVDLGVVRAAFGVAETGSVYLSEAQLAVNALGYLSQHLVVLLDPADVVGNLHHAFARPDFKEARYSVLMTGPSATADIEGVLIHGAQGVRSLTLVLVPSA